MSNNLLEVKPLNQTLNGASVSVPSSKPESQRGFVVSALAEGKSQIHNSLKSLETDTMLKNLESLGAKVLVKDSYTEIKSSKGF